MNRLTSTNNFAEIIKHSDVSSYKPFDQSYMQPFVESFKDLE